MKRFLLVFLYFLSCISTGHGGSGSLLLIGGGTERAGLEGWNGKAFQWAVNQSDNRRVAVITFYQGSATDWMPEHFVCDWGAAGARNFVINTTPVANDPATYDSLMNYDVFYIKGGNQADYYQTYNDTRVEQAIGDKYEQGGVICGTSAGLAILGEVDFTALNGTVYPDECLQNWDNQYVTLANDFLPDLMAGTIMDTHFVQRGRFARLLAFMANWQFQNGQDLTGIGLDDLTALAIDSTGMGQVYGTGCANLYTGYSNQPFHQEGNRFSVDSLRVRQLLQGCRIDFSKAQVSGFDHQAIPEKKRETRDYSLMLSGSNGVSENQPLLEHLVHLAGGEQDTIIVFTGKDATQAEKFRNALYGEDAEHVMVYTAEEGAADDDLLAQRIRQATKFVFVANDLDRLKGFMKAGGTGDVLAQRLGNPRVTAAFIGGDSRFAGRIVAKGYLDPGANYNSEMSYCAGLSLLQTTAVMPHTYHDPQVYENTAAALPYAMVQHDLAYGLWLASGGYVHYTSDGDQLLLKAHGDMPSMVLRNRGTRAGISQQTSTADPAQEPRQVAGFKSMDLTVLSPGQQYPIGQVADTQATARFGPQQSSGGEPLVYQSNQQLVVQWKGHRYGLELVGLDGKVWLRKNHLQNREVLRVNHLSPNLYIAFLYDHRSGIKKSVKMMIR